MNSRRENASLAPKQSTANASRSFAVNSPLVTPYDRPPGAMDDAALVRHVIAESMRRCSKSRQQIAEEMSHLVGRVITERMLNAFTAESREDHRFPAELDRAFCAATGDPWLLRCRAELAGFRVIDQEEIDLLELGRSYITRKRAEREITEAIFRLGRRDV